MQGLNLIQGKFLSTPSARRATSGITDILTHYFEISIHALREEGDPDFFYSHTFRHISIHALREEGDASTTRM